MEKISKNIQHGKTNTVTDTSCVDRHTLRLQTRRHKTVLKTKQEVKQITPKQCKWTKMTRNWFCCTLYCTIISPHAVHTHAVNFTHTTTGGHAPMSPLAMPLTETTRTSSTLSINQHEFGVLQVQSIQTCVWASHARPSRLYSCCAAYQDPEHGCAWLHRFPHNYNNNNNNLYSTIQS